jgi:cytochrome c peroxidase
VGRRSSWLWLLIVATGCSDVSQPLEFADQTRAGKVVLGSPSLVTGMPGDSWLTRRQIEAWLSNSAVHEPLEVCFPLGLHQARVTPNDALLKDLTRARIELGRQLFVDPRLAEGEKFSCGGCHDPKQHYKTPLDLTGVFRDPNVTFNRVFGQEQFWDGHAKSLMDQPFTPITNSAEMNTTPDALVARLRKIEGYRLQFERIFGRLDYESVCLALASFECAVVTAPSPWDYEVTLRELSAREANSLTADEQELLAEARAGAKPHPLSAAARRGAELFFSDHTKCATCHSGPNFTDERYYALGVEPANDDFGRYAVTQDEADRGAFKTPTLRNVEHTNPYMHNGRFRTLPEAVAWVAAGGEGPHSALEPVLLSPAELSDLVEFLKSLSSKVPRPEERRLPK